MVYSHGHRQRCPYRPLRRTRFDRRSGHESGEVHRPPNRRQRIRRSRFRVLWGLPLRHVPDPAQRDTKRVVREHGAGFRRDGPAGRHLRCFRRGHGQRVGRRASSVLVPELAASRGQLGANPACRSQCRGPDLAQGDTGSPGSARSSPPGPDTATSWPGLAGDEVPAIAPAKAAVLITVTGGSARWSALPGLELPAAQSGGT